MSESKIVTETKHKDYWKIKATFMETQIAVANANAKFESVMREAGLDPSVPYQLNDATESITTGIL